MMIQVPRAPLVSVADALYRAVLKYLAMERPDDATLQAPVAALVMSWSVARNIQAVTLLAKADEILIPAAWSNARTAFEVGVRIIWILAPSDAFERELRLLPMIDEYARYHENMDARKPQFAIADRHGEAAKDLRAYLTMLRGKIPPGYAEPPGIPSVESILKEIGNAHLYPAYIEASQYQHGSMAASSAYRRASAVFGETVNLREWLLPMRLAWITLQEVAKAVSLRLTGQMMDWGSLPTEMNGLISALAAADPST